MIGSSNPLQRFLKCLSGLFKAEINDIFSEIMLGNQSNQYQNLEKLSKSQIFTQ